MDHYALQQCCDHLKCCLLALAVCNSLDTSPLYNTDTSPLHTSPLYNMDTSPLYNTDTSPLYNMDTSPLYNMDTSPLYNMDTSPLYNMDTSPLYNMDSSPLYSMDTSPLYTSVNSMNHFTVQASAWVSRGLPSGLDMAAGPRWLHELFIVASGTFCGECMVRWCNSFIQAILKLQLAVVYVEPAWDAAFFTLFLFGRQIYGCTS